MLCAGFLAGQPESTHRTSPTRMPSTVLAEGYTGLDGHASPALRGNGSATAGGVDFRPEDLPESILERLRTALAHQAVRPVASLVASDGLSAHSADAEEMHQATVEALRGLESAFAGSRHKKLL